MTIIIGLIGLSIVVFIHELGHFLAAKASGIVVERFSIGMGKRLFGFRRGDTDYCVSLFPVGGFCKMKGEDSYIKALEDNADRIPPAPGSFYAASPWKRILVAVSGPLFNVIFAILALSVVWGVGFSTWTEGNRIVLSSDHPSLSPDIADLPHPLPADAAGLLSGDAIVAVDGRPTPHFRALQDIISTSAGKTLRLSVLRDGSTLELTLRPALLERYGIGMAGIQPWTEPRVDAMVKGSPADRAGLRRGDLIVEANGKSVPHSVALRAFLAERPSRLELAVNREGQPLLLVAFPDYQKRDASPLGISFSYIREEHRRANPFHALGKGCAETGSSLAEMFRGIGMLFRSRDFSQAFAGPARIAVTVGEVAKEGFSAGFKEGLASTLRMLSFISLALFLTNLLPIPVLDGGMVATCAAEILRGKPLRPRTLYRVTLVGLAFVLAIFLFSSYSDIIHFMGR